MKIDTVLLAAAIATVFAATAEADTAKREAEMEKCYGVVRTGQNGCANVAHACGGLTKKDRDRREWIELPKGTCERLVGGSKVAR